MGIILTDEEKKLIQEGKLNPADIMKHREDNPVQEAVPVDQDELEKIKQEIRDANVEYQQAIKKNKDLYAELEASRKAKEVCRNKIAELRKKKKEMLGK